MHRSHPMAKFQHMGGWYEDLKNWGESTFQDVKSTYVQPVEDFLTETAKDAGIPQSEIDKIKKEAAAAGQKELQSQLKNLEQQVTGGTTTAPTTTGKSIGEQIAAINQTAVLSYIPGGLYTIGGVGIALFAYMLLTKDR